MIKKILVGAGIFISLVFIFDYLFKPDLPEAMLSKIVEITANSSLMDSIGGHREIHYHYNDDFAKLDTFSYWIKVRGYTGELYYRSFESRLRDTEWNQLSDTLIIRKF